MLVTPHLFFIPGPDQCSRGGAPGDGHPPWRTCAPLNFPKFTLPLFEDLKGGVQAHQRPRLHLSRVGHGRLGSR